MPYKPTQFHLTIVKPYYKDNNSKPLQDALEDALKDILEDVLENVLEENHNQHALKGDYNSNTIVVNILQL